MTEQTIEREIVSAIVERLGLEIDPVDVDLDAPIFSSLAEGTEHEDSSLNLDSIDILEVVLALNATFDVELPDDQPEVFTSVRTIADYVRAHRVDAA